MAQIRNLGAPGSLSVTLSMVVDGTTVLSQPWSGTLASYETTGVVLGSYDTSGLGAFELVIDEADENPSNNSFTVEPPSFPKPTSPVSSTSPPTRGAMKPDGASRTAKATKSPVHPRDLTPPTRPTRWR